MTRLTLGAIDESAISPWQASIKSVVGKDVVVDDLRGRAAAAGTWHDHGVEFGVLEVGRLVALVQAFQCPRVSSPGAHEVGVLVLAPAERGHGVGTAALALLTELLFVERKAHRVYFFTDLGNTAMRRSGERVGFLLEGTVRGSVELDGVLHDDTLYGLTRDDTRAYTPPICPDSSTCCALATTGSGPLLAWLLVLPPCASPADRTVSRRCSLAGVHLRFDGSGLGRDSRRQSTHCLGVQPSQHQDLPAVDQTECPVPRQDCSGSAQTCPVRNGLEHAAVVEVGTTCLPRDVPELTGWLPHRDLQVGLDSAAEERGRHVGVAADAGPVVAPAN